MKGTRSINYKGRISTSDQFDMVYIGLPVRCVIATKTKAWPQLTSFGKSIGLELFFFARAWTPAHENEMCPKECEFVMVLNKKVRRRKVE